MIIGKQHRNKPLISLTDGKHVGEVKDFYFDSKLTTLAAVFTGKAG